MESLIQKLRTSNFVSAMRKKWSKFNELRDYSGQIQGKFRSCNHCMKGKGGPCNSENSATNGFAEKLTYYAMPPH